MVAFWIVGLVDLIYWGCLLQAIHVSVTQDTPTPEDIAQDAEGMRYHDEHLDGAQSLRLTRTLNALHESCISKQDQIACNALTGVEHLYRTDENPS